MAVAGAVAIFGASEFVGAWVWLVAVCSWADSHRRFLTASRMVLRDPLVARVGGGAGFGGRWWCGQVGGSTATVKGNCDRQGQELEGRLRRRLRGVRPRSGDGGSRSWAAVVACGRLCPGFPAASAPGGNHPGLGGVKPDHTLLWLRLVRLDTAQSGMVVQAPPKRRGIRDKPGLWCGLGPLGEAQRRQSGVCARRGNSSHRRGCPGFPVASAGEAKQAGPVVSSR